MEGKPEKPGEERERREGEGRSHLRCSEGRKACVSDKVSAEADEARERGGEGGRGKKVEEKGRERNREVCCYR